MIALNSDISIFQYADYRSFLKDVFWAKKNTKATWSYGTWARALQLKSPSTLVMILGGKRHPGPKLVEKMKRHLRLTAKEGRYFSDLVNLQKTSSDVQLQVALMDRLSTQYQKARFEELDLKKFSSIAKWYYCAIREMVRLPDFIECPDWVCGKLQFAVSRSQAADALKTLEELGLLKRNSQGQLEYADFHVETPSDISNQAIQHFQLQSLDNAKLSLTTVPPKEREIRSTTFAMSRNNLHRAKELLRKLEDDFCDELETDDADGVYQFSLAFYPLTKSEVDS